MIRGGGVVKYLFSGRTGNYAYVVSARRTAVGKFMGRMGEFKGVELANFAIQGTMMSANVQPELVEEVIMSCSVTAGMGQSPTRQASISAGLPLTTPCTTLNTSCSTSLKPIILGSKIIELGQSDLILTGGFQSFSNTPFYLPNHRKGLPYNHERLHDAIVTDFFYGFDGHTPLGLYAESIVNAEEIPKEVQDEVAIVSYERAIRAHKRNLFSEELIYLGEPEDMEKEEYEDDSLNGFRREVLKELKPIYDRRGSITVGNSAQVADGASAVLLASEKGINKHRIPPLARILGHCSVSVDPSNFCSSVSLAIQRIIDQTKYTITEIDLFEIGELFTISTIIAIRDHGIPIESVNIHGSCVSIGYPSGAVGGNLITSLISSLNITKKRLGIAVLNNGTGGSEALLLQNLRL